MKRVEVAALRDSTSRQLIVAGGIATSEEIAQLDAMKVDAVVGMAIYTGKMKLNSSDPRERQSHQ